MKRVFADASYWIGMTNPGDQWHQRAADASRALGSDTEVVTTEMVLTEVLNFFTRSRSHYWNMMALQTIDVARGDANVRIVPQTHDLFEAGLERFRQRLDQHYGHTDCVSMVLMEHHSITDVLTGDAGFQTAGFHIIM